MKKTFSSHTQVYVRVLKEPYDDQYPECFSSLGDHEIQFKIGMPDLLYKVI